MTPVSYIAMKTLRKPTLMSKEQSAGRVKYAGKKLFVWSYENTSSAERVTPYHNPAKYIPSHSASPRVILSHARLASPRSSLHQKKNIKNFADICSSPSNFVYI